MSKYIIKNCPCYDHDYEECLNTLRDEYIKCYDCTDCVLKQIVGKCMETLKAFNNGGKFPYAMGRSIEAEQILQLLDIQEVG